MHPTAYLGALSKRDFPIKYTIFRIFEHCILCNGQKVAADTSNCCPLKTRQKYYFLVDGFWIITYLDIFTQDKAVTITSIFSSTK